MMHFKITPSRMDQKLSDLSYVQLEIPNTPVLQTLNNLFPSNDANHPFFEPTNAHLKYPNGEGYIRRIFKEYQIQDPSKVLEVCIEGNLQNLKPEYYGRHKEVRAHRKQREHVVCRAFIHYITIP